MTELKTTQHQTSYNVLLIGDSCVDEYVWGTVDRLSPEAPVPIIKLLNKQKKTVPGMAANVFLNLKALGITADFVCNTEMMIKSRFIDHRSGQHLLRVDGEPVMAPWDGNTRLPICEYEGVVISDYNKGFLSYEHIERIISESTGPVFIDTKKTDLSRFSGAYVKINETEYNNSTSSPADLIITLGSLGAVLKTPAAEKVFPTVPAEVVDVCGCGDTFLSALFYKFLSTNNIDESITFANSAASLTVRHQGNYAPTLMEINNGH